jgi:hypothetical protein
VREPFPRVVVRETVLRGAQPLVQRELDEALEKLFLRPVPPVQGADPDAGAGGDRRDGCVRAVRGEHVARRPQQCAVVAFRLRSPCHAGHCSPVAERIAPEYGERKRSESLRLRRGTKS